VSEVSKSDVPPRSIDSFHLMPMNIYLTCPVDSGVNPVKNENPCDMTKTFVRRFEHLRTKCVRVCACACVRVRRLLYIRPVLHEDIFFIGLCQSKIDTSQVSGVSIRAVCNTHDYFLKCDFLFQFIYTTFKVKFHDVITTQLDTDRNLRFHAEGRD
jgi:hypothetical protein